MIRVISIILLALCFFAFDSTFAAVHPVKALDKKTGAYIERGTVIGGESGTGFSLRGLRNHFAQQTGIERLILELGDAQGEPLFGKVSYYTVNLEVAPPRIVIDLAQVTRSGVDDEKLKKIFAKSPYVKKAKVMYDPEDLTTTLVLELKKPLAVEVFNMVSESKTGRIALDLREIVKTQKKVNR